MSSDGDEAAIGEVVGQAYEALEFEAGSEPDWVRFDEIFVPGALLALRVFPEDEQVRVLGLREYHAAQMGNDLGDEGYSETPGERKVEILGDVAGVRQSFTMNFAGREPVEAVDIFLLARVDGRWMIVSVVSDLVSR